MKSLCWSASLSVAALPVLPASAAPPQSEPLEPVELGPEAFYFLQGETSQQPVIQPKTSMFPRLSSDSKETRSKPAAFPMKVGIEDRDRPLNTPTGPTTPFPESSAAPEFSTSPQDAEIPSPADENPAEPTPESAEPEKPDDTLFPESESDAETSPQAVEDPAESILESTDSESLVEENSSSSENSAASQLEDFIVFPVGFNVDDRPAILSVFVRGKEDLVQAVAFEQWLLPFEETMAVLQIDVTPLDSSEWELRSPGVVVRVNPDTLVQDPELGQAIPVGQIQDLLGVPVEFDIERYAINFSIPWSDIRLQTDGDNAPVNLEGLPKVDAPEFTAAALGQNIQIGGNLGDGNSQSQEINSRGNLAAVGTILGGSWFFQVDQSDLLDPQTWRLSEAQYLRQTETSDYVLGSQDRFWPGQGEGGLWGFTTVQRWGVQPTFSSGGGFAPRQRLQARQLGRTVSGTAPPGTLVRLVEGFGDRVLDEVLVDDSSTYEFENVAVGGDAGSAYQVLLYPDGQLTADPEIRDVSFSTLTEQLTQGTSALIASAGFSRAQPEDGPFWGEFTNFQGGVSYRRGLSENLTVGVGAVMDQSFLGLGELYYRPQNAPVEFTASALLNPGEEGLEVGTRLYWEPADDLTLSLEGQLRDTGTTGNFNLNWQAMSGLNFALSGNSDNEQLTARARYSRTSQNFFTFATLEYDTQSSWRWSFNSRAGQFGLSHQGTPATTASRLSYRLSEASSTGHEFQMGYETQSRNENRDRLATLNWRYRSARRTQSGQSLWDVGLGYGMGSQGSGMTASIGTSIIPGLTVRLRYQGVSLTSDTAAFRIELLPRLNVQSRISPGQTRFEQLRNQGGVLIRPFFDRNNNQEQDPGEELYTENSDLLLRLNNRSIRSARPDIRADGIYVQLPPDTYRLDIDPAGFPIDWQSQATAYAVDVAAGSYTDIPIPLSLSYTLSGVATNAEGNPLGGAKVEAVATEGENRVVSITNGGGVFFLEGLPQGTYQLLINGELAEPGEVTLDAASDAFQELNVQKL